MKLHINGEDREFNSPLSLAALLDSLGMKPGRVAVELNRSIVRKQDWSATPVEDGAEIEVVWFVGGGAARKDC